MDAVRELININFSSVFISVFIILIGIKSVVSILEWVIDKLGLETKWMKKQSDEHNLLIQTSQNLTALQEKRAEDAKQSDEHDEQIRSELASFIYEIKNSMLETQAEIKRILERNSIKDEQINNLMIAQREVLADKINEKYKYYISIDGIPEDEVDEFTDLHTAYKGVGGNHSGDAKYEYCINHLRVIPVEAKLIMKDNN